jgi:hypothetical protein
MEVMAVLFVVMFLILVVAICMVVAWPPPGDSPGGAGRDARDDPSPAGTPSHEAQPESLEGVLVRQLAAGEITRAQYLQAMSRLAERDAVRHPLEVPRD